MQHDFYALGAVLLVVSALGLFRLRDALARQHAATKSATLALGLILVGVALRAELGGWWILPAGLLWAFFWTGFMRVGSQASLFLAPIATVVLVFAWISVRTYLRR